MATRNNKKKKTGRKAAGRAGKAPRRAAARPKASSRGLSLGGVSPSFTANDLQKSMAFYCDVLGFTVKNRWESNGTLMGVEIAAGPVLFMLAQDDWKKGRDRVKGEGFRLYCDTSQDIDRLAAQIKARGGTLAEEPKDQEWGARTFAVQDPDGFKVTIGKQIRRR